MDPLTALAWFNCQLVKISWPEVSAYRLSLRGYADFGRRGLEALQELVENIRIRSPHSLVLLDVLAWTLDRQDHWSSEQTFKQVRSLGVDAVIVSPCAGRQELDQYFLLAVEEGQKELEVFVSCQGCNQSQKKRDCFNPTTENVEAGNDRWLDFLIGHLLSCEERAGIVLMQADDERFHHLRSIMAANPVSLLMPAEALAAGKNLALALNHPGSFDLGLVEVTSENLCRDPKQLKRINDLFKA